MRVHPSKQPQARPLKLWRYISVVADLEISLTHPFSNDLLLHRIEPPVVNYARPNHEVHAVFRLSLRHAARKRHYQILIEGKDWASETPSRPSAVSGLSPLPARRY